MFHFFKVITASILMAPIKKRGKCKMAKIDLTKYGITGTTEVVYNPSYEVLFEEETKAGLEGFEVGQERLRRLSKK